MDNTLYLQVGFILLTQQTDIECQPQTASPTRLRDPYMTKLATSKVPRTLPAHSGYEAIKKPTEGTIVSTESHTYLDSTDQQVHM